MKRCNLLITILLLLNPLIAGAEQYLCVPDKATGFAYNKNSRTWEQANLTTNRKYIVSKSDDEHFKRYAFVVIEIGQTIPRAICEKGFSDGGYLECLGVFDFRFNKKNGRYILTHTLFGYIDVLPNGYFPTDEKSTTPFIEIGKCSPF